MEPPVIEDQAPQLRWPVIASDYDGTLATHGRVTAEALQAIRDYRAAGGLFVLVTGRRLAELDEVFPSFAQVSDLVVVENGGVLFDPADPPAQTLAPKLPVGIDAVLRDHGVHDYELGELIVSTWRSEEESVQRAAATLAVRWPCQVVPNKDRVMLLPEGVDKAFGLRAACRRLGRELSSVVGVGDAENDAPLLAASGMGVAVANAVESLKGQADLVTEGRSSAGFTELITHLLSQR